MLDETQGAYFRGRKLKGKEVKVPEGYKGVIVKDAGNEQNAQSAMKTDQEGDLHDEDGDDEEEVKTIDEMGSFEEVVIWGHDSIADGDDAFVKGIGEWISFAEAVSPWSQALGQLDEPGTLADLMNE